MFELIKSHPWTCAIGGLILLGAIVGVIVGIVTKGGWKDRGFMRTDDGKHPLCWLKSSLPIACLVHPDAPLAWRATYHAAALRLNAAVGTMLFDPVAQEPPLNYSLSGPVPAGFILLCTSEPAGELQVDHGHTSLRWGRSDGRIFSCVVTVPTETPQRAAVMLHELGHVLGLDHDELTSSIMFPTLGSRQDPGELSDEDILRLKKAYT
jgi:hypothetical protein